MLHRFPIRAAVGIVGEGLKPSPTAATQRPSLSPLFPHTLPGATVARPLRTRPQPQSAMPDLDAARAILKDTFGYDGFRPGQAEIVAALMAGENVLAVMPTGSGKSLCYQLPALAGESLTVVVSPLIALMRDQVAALRLNGVAAGALNSAVPRAEAAETHRQMREGRLRLLYVSPERLMQPDVLDGLARLAPARFAIDEAHCISQWGHDFRPDYRRLAELPAHFPDARIGAFTATADAVTRQDIVERLFGGAAKVFVAGFDRPNLQIGIAPRKSATRQLDGLLDRHAGASGHRLHPVAQGGGADGGAGGAPIGRWAHGAALPRRHGPGRPRPAPGPLPDRRRRRHGRDHRLRHGHRQAGRPLRRPRQHPVDRRGLLPGDRPRRARRSAGGNPDALRHGRYPPAPPDDRRFRPAGGGQARRASAA